MSKKDSPFVFSARNCSLRMFPKASKAPAMARDSMFFLLHADRFTRSTKSNISLYGPFFRSCMILCTAASPTPFIAPKPKRISLFLFTEKKY